MTVLETVSELLLAAGDVLLRRRTSDRGVEVKSSHSDIVCDADKASEEALLEILRRVAPHDGVVSEEVGVIPGDGSSPRTWVLDPLDGTTNFVAGLDDFGVIVGVADDGYPIAGGMYLPAHDALYLAERGGGATRNGVRTQGSETVSVRDAVIDHSLASLPGIVDEQRRTLDILLPTVRAVRCNHSLRYIAHVLDGNYDGFVYHSLWLWDLVGPSVILDEAGITVSDLAGEPLHLAPTADAVSRIYGVIAARPALQAQLVDLLRPDRGR